MNMPHPVTASTSGITNATTATGPVVGLYSGEGQEAGTHNR